MSSKNIIIDVGANHGDFSLEIAKRNPDKTVIAFEPEPTLYSNLINNSKNIPNHKTYKLGIAPQNGVTKFYVSKLGDWGTSSLLPFDNNHLKDDDYWSTRTDLTHCEEIEIETQPLEQVLNTLEFDEISFIKIDAQGLDLEVLRSSGSYISRIQMGVLEVPSIKSTSLYNGENNSLIDVLNFLEENSFDVYSIKPNDPANNECNVFFVKKGLNSKELEDDCHLRNLEIYDGKNYWHNPSSEPDFSTSELMPLTMFQCFCDKLDTRFDNIEKQMKQMTFKYKLKKFISCFIPSKKLRKKIRGDV